MTRENELFERMKSQLKQPVNLIEGGFATDQLRAVAYELARIYEESIADALDKGMLDTAFGMYLDRKAEEHGVARKLATKSTGRVLVTGSPGTEIEVGTKVSSDSLTFSLVEGGKLNESGTITVAIVCDVEGVVGNVPAGAIHTFPIGVAGLNTVENPVALKGGYDQETDTELRGRVYDKIRMPATSGNKYHYIQWAKSVQGVGGVRVFPLWAGPGTVKVLVMNSQRHAAEASLLESVAQFIESERPIGAAVTVESVVELPINLAGTITLASDATIASVKEAFTKLCNAYFESLALSEDASSIVSVAKLGSLILSTPGVVDYSHFTANGKGENIALTPSQIPVLGVVNFV